MRKVKKLISSIILGLTSITLLAGCGNKDEGPIYNPETKEIPQSQYYFVNNGVTEYEILYPASDKTSYMSYAITELRTFFEKATGTAINAINDNDLVNPHGYYISLGNTTLFKESGITPTQELGYSGYGIKMIDKVVYIYCGDLHKNEGVLNGVYRLLNDAFKFEVFASDEIYVEPTHTRKLFKYDEEFLPTFDIRELAFNGLFTDSDYLKRMRQITRFGDTKEWFPNFYAHSQINMLLKREKYEAEHPEWYLPIMSRYGNLHWGLGITYNESTGELEFSAAADEIRDAMAFEVIEVLKKYTEQTIITIGEEDEPQFCSCDNCKYLMEKVAGYQSGLQIIFVNRVIEKVEEWIAEECPGREMQYVIFAYHGATITPPIRKNANGQYEALSKYVWPHEKMYIEYAPISAAYDHSFYDYQNASYKEYITGWNFLAPNRITLWTYNTNFSNYFINFNDFSVFEANVRFFAENGVGYYFGQGNHNAKAPTLQEMRVFVESNLIYDVDKESYDSLARRFMKHYYKEAGDDLYRYMDLLRENYAHYQAAEKDVYGSIYSSICNTDLYPESFVAKLKGCLDDALAHIAGLITTNPDQYELLKNRIMAQYCSVYFIILKLHKSMYTDEQIAYFKENLYKYAEMFKFDHANEAGAFDNTYFG
ncbi:MAG: DUF4838 domain-containing protein [Bacilli bacterium]|nr:DUF4838 domain-containing protein [Bacilli bacterium]